MAARLAKEISAVKDPSQYTARDWFVKAIDADDLQQELSCYTKAIEIDPEYTAAYNNRGITFDKLERYDDSLADYAKAIEVDSGNTVASFNSSEIQIITDSYYAAAKTLSNDNLDLTLPKDRATSAWLRCVATAASGGDTNAVDAEFQEAMKVDFTHTFGTKLIEQWVEPADLPVKTKDYIRRITKQFKTKLKENECCRVTAIA